MINMPSLPKVGVLSIWSGFRSASGALVELALSYPLPTSALLAFVYVVTGFSPINALITLTVMVLIYVAGPSSRARLLSLADAVKFSYRRLRIRRSGRKTFLNAGIYRTEYSPHLGQGQHGPNHRVTPKIYRFGRKRIKRTANGITVTVNGARAGYGSEAFEGETAQTMRAAFKCRDVIVTPHPVWNWLTILRLVYGDPFAAVIHPSQLPSASTPWHVVVGLDSDSLPIEKDLRLPILIAGAQGAGKSSECWRILQSLVEAAVPFRTRVYDPKGGQEFDVLADKAHYYESRPTKWCDFLEKAIRAMQARQHALKALGLRDCPVGDPRFPLDVMIIDELVTVIAMMANEKVLVDGQKVPALKAFMVYLSQCRAAGFTVVACTQLTQKEAIGVIRDLFGYVTCLRVGSAEMVRTVLGDPKTYPAHQIPAGRRWGGIGFMATDTGPKKYRAAFVDDASRTEVANAIGVMTQMLADTAEAEDAVIPAPRDAADDSTDDAAEVDDFLSAVENFANAPQDPIEKED
jgi:hypothetical protein